jgi:hypothetical protein
MGSIFISQPGQVAIIRGANTLPGSISIQSNGQQFSDKVIITGFNYGQASHVQFQQSLLNAIYLWSFGEKMGQVRISGLCFSDTCSNTAGSGVEEVLKYYGDARVSNGHPRVTVLVGAKPIYGYLIGCQIASVSVEQMTYGFDLVIAAVPAYLDAP